MGLDEHDGHGRADSPAEPGGAVRAQELVTALVAEVDATDAVTGHVHELVGRAGGVLTALRPPLEGRALVATFRTVGDATWAAAILRQSLGTSEGAAPGNAGVAAPTGGDGVGVGHTGDGVGRHGDDTPDGRHGNDGAGGPSPGAGLRIALCTGEAGGDGSRAGGTPHERAARLATRALPYQVLVTASTAVLAGRSLPPGAELVDRGNMQLGHGRPPERVYEMRMRLWGAEDVDRRPGTSNLDWARRAVDGPVLGFDEPLAALVRAWKETLDGRHRVALLSGPAAPAVTVVAAEFALRLHAEGATVLHGRWDDPMGATPYQAVREALGVHADGCDTAALRADVGQWGDDVGRLLPDVGARLGLPPAGPPAPPVAPDPERQRPRLFRGVEAWLAALAARNPTLVVLTDLDRAEADSVALLDHLRHGHGRHPLLVLVTAALDEAASPGSRERVAAFASAPEPGEFDAVSLSDPR